MAIGDIGMFLPSESQYKTPGAYDAMLRSEALKRATYLSSMDQFYAQLDEAQRQFDETLSLKREQFGFEKEAFGKEFGLAEKEFGLREELGRGELELGRSELELERELGTRELDLAGRSLNLEAESLRTQRMLGEKELGLKERELSLEERALGGNVSEREQFTWLQEQARAGAERTDRYLDLVFGKGRAEQAPTSGQISFGGGMEEDSISSYDRDMMGAALRRY